MTMEKLAEMNTLISSKFSGDYGRNPETGEHWMDEHVNRRAREKGQRIPEIRRPQGANGTDYEWFDRERYITDCLEEGRPVVITWVPSSIRLNCRDHQDIFGIPDIAGIKELRTLFSDVKGMENLRIFLIPYLITGYDIPEELERDEEPLVPFTAKTLSILKEIEEEDSSRHGDKNG